MNYENLIAQWDGMLSRSIMPIMEFQTAEDEYLIVEITLPESGDRLLFSFDREPLFDVNFSGEITHAIGDTYQLNFDEYTEDLDIYLQQISREITEGYLLPNNLYYFEG